MTIPIWLLVVLIVLSIPVLFLAGLAIYMMWELKNWKPWG